MRKIYSLLIHFHVLKIISIFLILPYTSSWCSFGGGGALGGGGGLGGSTFGGGGG